MPSRQWIQRLESGRGGCITKDLKVLWRWMGNVYMCGNPNHVETDGKCTTISRTEVWVMRPNVWDFYYSKRKARIINRGYLARQIRWRAGPFCELRPFFPIVWRPRIAAERDLARRRCLRPSHGASGVRCSVLLKKNTAICASPDTHSLFFPFKPLSRYQSTLSPHKT